MISLSSHSLSISQPVQQGNIISHLELCFTCPNDIYLYKMEPCFQVHPVKHYQRFILDSLNCACSVLLSYLVLQGFPAYKLQLSYRLSFWLTRSTWFTVPSCLNTFIMYYRFGPVLLDHPFKQVHHILQYSCALQGHPVLQSHPVVQSHPILQSHPVLV